MLKGAIGAVRLGACGLGTIGGACARSEGATAKDEQTSIERTRRLVFMTFLRMDGAVVGIPTQMAGGQAHWV
jgi:hypothetical protein